MTTAPLVIDTMYPGCPDLSASGREQNPSLEVSKRLEAGYSGFVWWLLLRRETPMKEYHRLEQIDPDHREERTHAAP